MSKLCKLLDELVRCSPSVDPDLLAPALVEIEDLRGKVERLLALMNLPLMNTQRIEELEAMVERLDLSNLLRLQNRIETLEAKVRQYKAQDRELVLEVMAEHLVTKEEALEALRERGGS